MAILSNQRRGAGLSRHNFKDDMGILMGWIEDICDPSDEEAEPNMLRLDGYVSLSQINRIRAILRMPPIETAEQAEGKTLLKCGHYKSEECSCKPESA